MGAFPWVPSRGVGAFSGRGCLRDRAFVVPEPEEVFSTLHSAVAWCVECVDNNCSFLFSALSRLCQFVLLVSRFRLGAGREHVLDVCA